MCAQGQCEAKGCCWDPQSPKAWCYHMSDPARNVTDPVHACPNHVNSWSDCGVGGISEEDVRALRACGPVLLVKTHLPLACVPLACVWRLRVVLDCTALVQRVCCNADSLCDCIKDVTVRGCRLPCDVDFASLLGELRSACPTCVL